jgi:hypothetical protein
MTRLRKFKFGSQMHMLPIPKNHISKCQKNSYVHLYNPRVFLKFHEKPTFHVVDVKRQNTYSKIPYF